MQSTQDKYNSWHSTVINCNFFLIVAYLIWWHCFLSTARALCWADGVSQQPVGPVTGPAGPGGGALPVARAQCRRLASLLQHGSVRPRRVYMPLQLPPAAHLLHCLHLWLVSESLCEGPPHTTNTNHQRRVIVSSENWSQCLVSPTGTKCRRPVWHWTAPWRISPWSSTVRNYLLPLSHIMLHGSSSASPSTVWAQRSAWWIWDKGLNVVNIPATMENAVSHHFFQELGIFFTSRNWKQLVFDTSIVKIFIWKIIFLLLLLPPMDFDKKKKKVLSAKWTPGQAHLTLCNKMDDSLEMGTPPMCLGRFCFLNKNPVYKMYNWFKSYWSTVHSLVNSIPVSVQYTTFCG